MTRRRRKEKPAPNEFGVINPDYKNCNHNIKSQNTSIVFLSENRTFTFPEHIYGICKCCGKPFHYVRYQDGSLKPYDKKDEEGK